MRKFSSDKYKTLYCAYHRIKTRHNSGKDVLCDEWNGNFDAFAEWAIEAGHTKGVMLKKLNENEPYSPTNCCWVSRVEVQKKSPPLTFLKYNGKTRTLGTWAKNLGLSYVVLRQRYDKGMKPEEILRVDALSREAARPSTCGVPVEAYERLANAIIVGAADDYRSLLKINKRYPDREERMRCSTEEKFFHSRMYEVLTSVPAEVIINGLKKEVWNDD